MNGYIRQRLISARKAIPALLRSEQSEDGEWRFVPTEEIHRVTRQALDEAGLALFRHTGEYNAAERIVAVQYELMITAEKGDGAGQVERFTRLMPLDDGPMRSTLLAGALAILDREVRKALLDLVMLHDKDSAARVARPQAQRSAPVNRFIAPGPLPGAIESAKLDDITGKLPGWADLSADADAVIAEIGTALTSEPDPPADEKTAEVWKAEATAKWIAADAACGRASVDKPDLAKVIAKVCKRPTHVDDLTSDQWAQVVVELDKLKSAAELVGGAS